MRRGKEKEKEREGEDSEDEDEGEAEVARLKVARIFNPLHVLGYQISVADIDSLQIFRLTEHPLIMPHIEGMKSEIIKYHTLVNRG